MNTNTITHEADIFHTDEKNPLTDILCGDTQTSYLANDKELEFGLAHTPTSSLVYRRHANRIK